MAAAPPATATPSPPTRSRRGQPRPGPRRSTTGAMPDDRIRLELGQWATPTPPLPTGRSRRGRGACATQARSLIQPTSSNRSTRPAPKVARANSSSSAFSARWWSRTSRRSSETAGGVGHQLGGDGEQASSRRRRGPGRGGGRRGARRGQDLVVVAHESSGGSPPSFSDTWWKRMPRVAAASISALIRSPAPFGWRYRWSVDVVQPPRATRPDPPTPRNVSGLLVDAAPLRVQRLQPAEQRRRRHHRPRPRQVLEEVVVGVHQARCDEAPGTAEGPSAPPAAPSPTAQRRHQAAVDRHPAAPGSSRRSPSTVAARLGVPDQEVHRARIRHDADSGSRSHRPGAGPASRRPPLWSRLDELGLSRWRRGAAGWRSPTTAPAGTSSWPGWRTSA